MLTLGRQTTVGFLRLGIGTTTFFIPSVDTRYGSATF